jgi:hypothetical protein
MTDAVVAARTFRASRTLPSKSSALDHTRRDGAKLKFLNWSKLRE